MLAARVRRRGEISSASSKRGFQAVALVVALVTTSLAVPRTSAAFSSDDAMALPFPGPSRDYMRYINVNDFRFDPLSETPDIPALLRYDGAAHHQPDYYLVQFNGPITEAMKASLEATGAELLYYISHNAFTVRATGTAIERASHLPSVRWTGMFEPAYKLSPRLSERYDEILQRAIDATYPGVRVTGAAAIGSDADPRPASFDVGIPSSGGRSSGGFDSFAPGPGSVGPITSLERPGPDAPRIETSERIRIHVLTFERSGLLPTTQTIAVLGGSDVHVVPGTLNTVLADVPHGSLARLAHEPSVMWIDRATQPYVFNDIARWVIQSGNTTTRATPIHDRGIHGTGQVITVGDTGIDHQHDAFEDPAVPSPGPTHRKVTGYYVPVGAGGDGTDNTGNHGTHVSGTVAGDDGSWHIYDGDNTGSNVTAGPHDGQAFDATLHVQDLSPDGFGIYPPSDLHTMYQEALTRGSTFHTNSWGDCCSDYITEAAQTDDFIWANQGFIVLYAAGNAGSGLNSTNPFAVAKNVIAVGATLNGPSLERVAPFSSRGPAADGRLKPDVMAPGVNTWSAHGCDPGPPCDDYVQFSGTSMATPTTAGAAALTRQYFMDGWYPTGSPVPGNGFTPTAALVKAMLINGAAEMSGSGAYDNGQTRYPNFNQGWGRILLDDATFFAGDTRGLVVDDHTTGLTTGSSVTYALAIGDPTEPVEITLVWSDYMGVPMSTPNLVNDLDLTVTAPDGTVYRGNQYTGYNPGESAPNPPGADHLNNVEGVLVLTNVQTGLWTITVDAINVPQPAQTFAVVMAGGIATERGSIQMGKNSYKSSATVSVKVVDTGLNTNPLAPDTVSVNLSSTTETTAESVTMTETGAATAVFAGSIALATGAAAPNGLLEVANGDTITAAYFDANNGLGGSGNTYDTAVVDDSPPVITGVRATGVRFNRATITWTTDELSDSVVSYGTATPPGTTAAASSRVTNHSIKLTGLSETTTYFFSVRSTDEAGNVALDDNGTAYYRFTTTPKPPTAPPNVEWPTFHNNLPRQGQSPSPHLPPISQQWVQGPYEVQVFSGPALADGRVFSAGMDGYLRARDPYTGEVLWERLLGGTSSNFYTSTPAVESGVVYATFYTDRILGFLYALDAATGETIWVVGPETGLNFNARVSLAVGDGMVFGSSWDGEIFALKAADGSVVWTFQTGDLPWGGVTVAAGHVFQGSVYTHTVWALDEATGSLEWSTSLDDFVVSAPLYGAGMIYVGTTAGTMYSLNAFDGSIAWQTGGLGPFFINTPASDGGTIYFGTDGSRVYALDAITGAIRWSTGIPGFVESSPAVANGYLYLTASDGFRTFRTTDGSIVDFDTLLSGGSASSPAVSDGWVWIDDTAGNAYGFLGQLLVGLLVRPSTLAADSVPNNPVDHRVTVTNVGTSGPDTFDATVTPGTFGWAVDLFQANGVTPLADSDGDTIPDTGSVPTGSSVDIVIRVRVPSSVHPRDSETSIVTFTSSNDPSRSRAAKAITTIPPPGTTVGPRGYFALAPGDMATQPMTATNTGGFPDTIDITAVSGHGWTTGLFTPDGATPLADTDSDGTPDVGNVTGLGSATFVVRIQVPPTAPLDLLDKTLVTSTSSWDTVRSSSANLVIELAGPPASEWPQFHHDRERSGVSPVPFEMPLTQRWTAAVGGLPIRSAPVISGHTVYVAEDEGNLLAVDIGTGTIKWQVTLGDFGFIAGTPAVSTVENSVYAAFVTGLGITLFSVHPADGGVNWRYDSGVGFGAAAHTTIAVAAGKVYWSDGVGRTVLANDAVTGALRWSRTFPGTLLHGPTYWADMVFAGDASGTLVALDASTGSMVWQKNLGGTITSAPTVVNGVLYVGKYSPANLFAIDPLSGATIWTSAPLGVVIDFSSPVVAEGRVFVGTFDAGNLTRGWMHALNAATGASVWSYPLFEDGVGTSPAYNNGTVFVSARDGYLYGWKASDGTLLERLPLAPYGGSSSVAIADGYLVVGDESGKVTGFSFVGAGVTSRVAMSPATTSLAVTAAVVLEAAAFDRYENEVGGETFAWSSLDGLGTAIPLSIKGTQAVYVAGTTAGTDRLRLSVGTVSFVATITVHPGAVDRVVITPGGTAPIHVVAGEALQLSAISQDRFGNSIPNRTFTWAASGDVGTIGPTGVFAASTAVGTGEVTATDGAAVGRVVVRVVPGPLASIEVSPSPVTVSTGGAALVTATALDQYRNEISGLMFTWTATIGSIQAFPDGRVALFSGGESAGTGTITATSGGTSATVSVTVTSGALPLERQFVQPSSLVFLGLTIAFVALSAVLFFRGRAIKRKLTEATEGAPPPPPP